VEFRILGPLEVWHDEASVRIPGVKERALLVLLLLHANEPVPVDRLIDELWDGRPPPTARPAAGNGAKPGAPGAGKPAAGGAKPASPSSDDDFQIERF